MGLSNFFNSVINYVAPGQTPDTRQPDTTRARIDGADPTVKIDQPDKTTILKFPSDLPKYYISFGFQNYRRPSIYEGLSSDGITDYIALPLPSNLRDSTSYQWTPDDGWMGADNIGPSLQGMSDALRTGSVSSFASSGLDAIQRTGETLVGGGVNQLIAAGNDLTGNGFDAVKQLLGVADNPFQTVFFKGANFKQHNFQWRMSPRNAAESQSLKKIIDTFKKISSPGLLNAAVGGFYEIPDIVWIKLNPQELRDATYTFKPCAVTSVHIDWAPERPSFHADSTPVEIIFGLDFIELELWRNGGTGAIEAGNGDFDNIDSPPGRNLGTV